MTTRVWVVLALVAGYLVAHLVDFVWRRGRAVWIGFQARTREKMLRAAGVWRAPWKKFTRQARRSRVREHVRHQAEAAAGAVNPATGQREPRAVRRDAQRAEFKRIRDFSKPRGPDAA